MAGRLTSKLTYGNVMATIAVFVALGGGYALAKVGGNGTVKVDGVKGLSSSYVKVISVAGVGTVHARCDSEVEVEFTNTSGGKLYVRMQAASPDTDFVEDLLADGGTLDETFFYNEVGSMTIQAFAPSDSGSPSANITMGSYYDDGGSCNKAAVSAQAVSK